MIRIERRFEVKLISAPAFAAYMKYREFTVRQLADTTGAHRATIGHLRSGARKTCDPALARRIERTLQAPPGSLFVPTVSNVAREVGPRVKASA